MPKNWYLVNIAGNFFSNQPRLKGTVSREGFLKETYVAISWKVSTGLFLSRYFLF